MKATLSFNLPEQQEEWESYLTGPQYQSLVHEFDQLVLRSITKYGAVPKDLSDSIEGLTGDSLVIAVIDWIRTQLYNKASDFDISVV